MSYRDDGDAALARADALQHDVDAYQEKLVALRVRLEQSEKERERLAKLAHEELPAPTPPPVVEDDPISAETILIYGAMLIVALFALVMLGAHHR